MFGAQQGGILGMVLPFVLLFVIMYFMIIRPQKKRDKLVKEMLAGLIKGDKVLTIGGIIGKIVSLKDDEIVIETGRSGSKSTITLRRNAVNEVLKAAPDPEDNYDEGSDIPESK